MLFTELNNNIKPVLVILASFLEALSHRHTFLLELMPITFAYFQSTIEEGMNARYTHFSSAEVKSKAKGKAVHCYCTLRHCLRIISSFFAEK
jgi:hypothetical protein